MLETALDAVIVMSTDGRVADWNQCAEQIFGWRRDEAVGRPMAELIIPPQHREAHARGLERFLAIGAGQALNRRIEITALRRDGSEFPIELSITAIASASEPLFLGFLRDISARKATEAALRASEERLRDITDAMPVLISYVDAEQRFRFANKAFEEWFGRPLADIAGRHLHEVSSEGMYEMRRPYVERALAGEVVSYEMLFPHVTGPRLAAVRHTPHFYAEGRVLGIYTLIQDLTEQKRTEAALRESRDRLEAVLDAAPAAILIASDSSCTEIQGNRQATELMRMPPRENLSRSAATSSTSHFRVFDMRGRELAPDELPVQRAERGEELWRHEEQVVFDDGTIVYLLGNAVPLKDDAGTIRGAVGAFIDITDRKRAELHQRLLINELNHRVKNTLAIVQGIAHQSFKGEAADPMARAAFEGRLSALSAAHDVLMRENWEKVQLREIITKALAPFVREPHRLSMTGPDLRIAPKAAVSFAMAFHELGTNAAKYGALANEQGRITIDWHIAASETGSRLMLDWREEGGPPVITPVVRGFGTRMIERGLAAELDGSVRLDFDPSGLRCRIDAPFGADAANS